MSQFPERQVEALRFFQSMLDDAYRALGRGDLSGAMKSLTLFERAVRAREEADEALLLPALARAAIPGRDARMEIRLHYRQLRELSGILLQQSAEGAPLAMLLGLARNLEKRLRAHREEMESVYYPAAESVLTDGELRSLNGSISA